MDTQKEKTNTSAESSSKTGQTVRINVDGDMTGDRVHELEEEFNQSLENNWTCSNVLLDLKDVRLIDSRGISLCIGLYKECNTHKVPFSIEASSEAYRILKFLNLDRDLDIKECKEDGNAG
jgi:anti-anti-sigma factor